MFSLNYNLKNLNLKAIKWNFLLYLYLLARSYFLRFIK
ncbi:hypothetical protein CAMGR0001_1048 [Campylobacter gracilis RM3268]|uniref:Uncharacterized protein n=1 Tax=Campylobacter gracilis RM3268 TaxID=553220 RepID=C8PGQ4_9BACT|nr:hypothetical protein CAMGR0001_1048 [Campylobacter gracilis RM3268]